MLNKLSEAIAVEGEINHEKRAHPSMPSDTGYEGRLVLKFIGTARKSKEKTRSTWTRCKRKCVHYEKHGYACRRVVYKVLESSNILNAEGTY